MSVKVEGSKVYVGYTGKNGEDLKVFCILLSSEEEALEVAKWKVGYHKDGLMKVGKSPNNGKGTSLRSSLEFFRGTRVTGERKGDVFDFSKADR